MVANPFVTASASGNITADVVMQSTLTDTTDVFKL